MARALILLAVVLTACGGADDRARTPTPERDASSVRATATGAPPASPTAEPTPTPIPTPADLSVSIEADATITLGEPASVVVIVANIGGLPAQDVDVLITLGGGYTLDALKADDGVCDVDVKPPGCAFDEVAGDSSVNLRLSVNPTRSGELTMEVSASMAGAEPTPDDNHAQASLAVTFGGYSPPELPVELVSVGSFGALGNANSCCPSLSADGRHVAFVSWATNLAPGLTESTANVFVYDRQADTLELISAGPDGSGNGDSLTPAISGDGRYVAYASGATILTERDENAASDVFLFDRQTGATTLVSRGAAGATGKGLSIEPSISGDGRFVAFTSTATDLVSDDTNNRPDVFVYDRETDTLERASVTVDGDEGEHVSDQPAISADGRFIAFRSRAPELTGVADASFGHILLLDRSSGELRRLTAALADAEVDGDSMFPTISSDGRVVAFESRATNLVDGDTNETTDIFVWDLTTGTVERVNLTPAGVQATGVSRRPRLSGDGRLVVFLSRAANLVEPDPNGQQDVFIRDRAENTLVRIPSAVLPSDGDDSLLRSSISADGRYIAFATGSPDFARQDDNDVWDVFVLRR